MAQDARPPACRAVFDGSGGELSSRRCVLRVRFYNKDRKAVITFKGEQVLAEGIGTAEEEEEEVDPAAARGFLAAPQSLLDLDSPLLRKLRERHTMRGLVCLGGFDNFRKEFVWRGHLLEVDQTSYPWGTRHELECETVRAARRWQRRPETLASTYFGCCHCVSRCLVGWS